MQESITELNRMLNEIIHTAGYPLRSRIHPLRGFGEQVFVKRDDEVSFGISGSKLRKLISLIHHWQKHGIQKVEAVGGANSNHIVAVCQVCNELGMPYRLHLLKSHAVKAQSTGNQAYVQLLSRYPIHWVEREDWQEFMVDYEQQSGNDGQQTYFMLEGGANREALLGAMTLGKEIVEQCDADTDLYVDAGTGTSAAGLCYYLSLAGFRGTVHVVRMVKSLDFSRVLNQARQWGKDLGLPEMKPLSLQCLQPPTAASFGGINQRVITEIKEMAQTNGIISDPLYSAKLFMTVRERTPCPKKVLVIHSGGGLSLGGFWEKILPSS